MYDRVKLPDIITYFVIFTFKSVPATLNTGIFDKYMNTYYYKVVCVLRTALFHNGEV